MGCKEDFRCSPVKPYPCMKTSTTYLPCGGDCKPIKRKSDTNLASKKKWLNCCSYCIKTRSCGKVETEYLKLARYNDPHYLKTGKGCVTTIENKYLKDEQKKRKACNNYRKTRKAQKKLEREGRIEIYNTEKEKKLKEMKKYPEAQEKEEKENIREIMEIELKENKKKKKMQEKKQIQKHNEKYTKRPKNMYRLNEKMAKKADYRHKNEREKLKKKYKQEKNKKYARAKPEKKQNKEERHRMDKLEKKHKKLDKESKRDKDRLKAMQKKLGKERDTDKLENKQNKKERHRMDKLEKKRNKEERHMMDKLEKEHKKPDEEMKHNRDRLEAIQKKLDKEKRDTMDKLEKKQNKKERHRMDKLEKKQNKEEPYTIDELEKQQKGLDEEMKHNKEKRGKLPNKVRRKGKKKSTRVHEKYEVMCKCGLKYKEIELQDAIDQTGEPAFEVQVRRGGLEIANLEEVQQNVKNLGKSRIPCTCPTFNRNLQHSIKNVCPTGACKTALNSKSISINCKCESRKSRFCTEKTCLLKSNPLATPGRIIDPLFSLNVDIDKNTILNSNEIQNRITNYRDKHNICKIGRCRDAFNTNEMDFTCKCRSSSGHHICTDETCGNCICVKEKGEKGEIKRCPENRPMQGVSVTVGRKEDGYCDCGADNCHCPRWSRLACIARFCCKQGKSLNKKLDYTDDGAYCCDKCQESNNKQSEKSLEEATENKTRKAKAIKEKKKKTKKQAMKKQQNKTKTKVKVEKEGKTKGKATNEKQFTANTKATEREEAKASTKAKATVKEDAIELTRAKATMKEEAKKQTKAKSGPKPNKTVEETKKKKELRMWEKEEKLRMEEEGNVNLISSCVSGLTSWIIAILRKFFSVLYRCVRHPKSSFAYAEDKLKNPELTYSITKRWGTLLYRSKMMRIKNNIDRSETGRMLTDEILTNKFVRLFLPNSKEMHNNLLMRQERKSIRKNATMHSCKHMFLLTLRKTPCLWFYYLCPAFYGPFLSCLAGFRKLMEALMAVGAIIVWTPCFVLVETFRFIFCCTMCTV